METDYDWKLEKLDNLKRLNSVQNKIIPNYSIKNDLKNRPAIALQLHSKRAYLMPVALSTK